MRQVFFHYADLEEHEHGMWRTVPAWERDEYINASEALMKRPGNFESAMRRAAERWPKSTEAAMTTPGLNRRAWMGHAGCCVECGSPEDLTRLAWHRLSPEEQDAANEAADRAILSWEASYATISNGGLF